VYITSSTAHRDLYIALRSAPITRSHLLGEELTNHAKAKRKRARIDARLRSQCKRAFVAILTTSYSMRRLRLKPMRN